MSTEHKALLLGLTAVILWSTVATAFKLALSQLDVFQLLFYAVSASLLFFFLLLRWQGKLRLLAPIFMARPHYFMLMGLLNPVLYYLVLFRAYDLLPAQQAQAINYTWAIAMGLMAVPLLGQRLSRRDVLAALLCYTAVLIIVSRGDTAGLRFENLEGVAYALGSTLIWAFYWIINTRTNEDPVVALCLNFCVALPCTLLLCVLFSTPVIHSVSAAGAAIYVGFFEMGVTFALWASALKLTRRVASISNLIFLSPLLSLVFIATVLGEVIHPATLVGLALIIPAVWWQQRQHVTDKLSD